MPWNLFLTFIPILTAVTHNYTHIYEKQYPGNSKFSDNQETFCLSLRKRELESEPGPKYNVKNLTVE